ncbi:hypothetical protein AG1IA_10472 [Rhizoctonia solani AG-1 IA]|uniref:Uncharacterized protein n=1 Tax=Thanatephorus cucumeris (strain AG1-IA) TaxID=983506 RepID=L8WFD7_THACA|nr:hypothetical protein AG1IA_10472 [Rhizoctonia solani AG-1 IA]
MGSPALAACRLGRSCLPARGRPSCATCCRSFRAKHPCRVVMCTPAPRPPVRPISHNLAWRLATTGHTRRPSE